jgi:polar amino acid transport system substrate-binding protein
MTRTIHRLLVAGLLGALAGVLGAGQALAQQSQLAQLVAESTLTKATKSKTLRVGWAQWEPFMYVDPKTNKLTGFTVDLYENHLAPALGVKIVWVEDSWSTIMAGLQANKFDIVANANRTLKRLLVAEYAGPISRTQKALLATKQNVGKFQGWQSANNPSTKICVALGSSADTAVTASLAKAEIMRLPGDPACIAALAAGRTDLYSTDLGNLAALTKEHPEFVVLPNGAFATTELGIFVKQGDQIMLNWLNQYIREIKLDGTVDALIKKYNLQGAQLAW